MSINKYKIRLVDFESDDNVKIPLSLDFNSVDQAEVVNRDFIAVETEKSINPIVDYEKVRFTPKLSDGTIIKDLTFNLNFLSKSTSLSRKTFLGTRFLFLRDFRSLTRRISSRGYLSPTYYSDLGFIDDDIKFQKNKFKNSFLRLSFYDSDIPTSQNLVSMVTIFSRITVNDIVDLVDNSGNPQTGGGLPKNADKIVVKYILNNPITKPEGFAEGFYVYHFKSDVAIGQPHALYMRAEFNNAATGEITKFITTSELLNINSVIKKLHTKYLLTRDSTGFYYTLDPTYNSAVNIQESGSGVRLNLYEIQVQ